MNPDLIRLVLVRPEEAGNIGAAARVLKNFGLSRLVLVAPSTPRPEDAMKWAHGAEDVLEGADHCADLSEALQGCTSAYALTRRRGRLRGQFLGPRDAARESAARARAGQPVAWVFGPESRGLTTAEASLCSARVTIPTSPRQPSLNLAQAVAVCAYEIGSAVLAEAPAAPRREAAWEEREALYRHLESALLAIRFLHPHTARSRMAALRAVLERAGLTSREARLVRGMARQMEWAAGAKTESTKKREPGTR
jgi:tRNA/rRNA methyltransferase